MPLSTRAVRLAALGVAFVAALSSIVRAQKTPEPQNIPLVTGKLITPQGRQTNVGSFPANLLLSPDGRFVVVTNVGYRQYVSVLSAEDGRLISQVGFNAQRTDDPKRKEGLYYGLAFGPVSGGTTTVYAARGVEDKVSVLTLAADGTLQNTGKTLDNPSGVPGGILPNSVAGIALNGSGSRLYTANNTGNPLNRMRGSLTIVDTAANKRVAQVEMAGYPYAVAAVTQGRSADKKVYVTSEQRGTVSVIDPAAGRVSKEIETGTHPMALLLDKSQARLFVANAGSDTISIVRTYTDAVERTLLLRPDDVRGLPGATPTGLALSPDEKRLYVTLADMNAVAVVDLPGGTLAGYIPVGWYPTAVAASRDGKRLFVANAKGVNVRNPNSKPVVPGERSQYIQNIIEGTVSTIDVPDATTLRPLTARVIINNRVAPNLNERASALLKNPGIEHVIYVIKENRTYDQVLGDLPQGNGDASLCLFPRAVTPNQHALAERFVLLDNFYCCAEVSADGWNWSTSGMISEYTARNTVYNYAQRGRPYDFEGQNNGVAVDLLGIPDVARAPSGYIWDHVAKAGLSYRNYGFFTAFPPPKEITLPPNFPGSKENEPTKKALVPHTDLNFRLYDMTYADSDAWVIHNAPAPNQMKEYGAHKAPSRFAAWKREFDAYVKNNNLPRFQMVRLPRDHTSGTAPGAHSPRAMVADNDYAVGQLVEAVSKSQYWKKTAIFILEDDAQNGFDHVDAHRSIAFVISPFIKKATRDSRFYNTDSMLRTMELLLGLPPMNQYDAIAAPIAVFDPAAANDAPFEAILPAREIVAEVNKSTAYRAKDSARLLNPLKEESDPDEELNDILWHALKGKNTPKPARRYSLRLSVDEDDN